MQLTVIVQGQWHGQINRFLFYRSDEATANWQDCQPLRGTRSPSPSDWSKTLVPNWAHSSFILVQTQVLSAPDAFPTVLT